MNNSGKLVSIIIPVYNSENFIRLCVESCLAQTYKDVEIIVIDDGSTDGTKEKIKDFIDSNKICYYFQTNQERSVARNYGLFKARGDYIQFLDSDDILSENKIQLQVEYLEKNKDYFGVRCNTQYIDKDGNFIKNYDVNHEGYITSKLLECNFIPIHSMLIKRNSAKFDVNKRLMEDWKYWLTATFSKKIGYIDDILCTVVMHETNSSSCALQMKNNVITVVKELLKTPLYNEFKLKLLVVLLKNSLKLLQLRLFKVLK